jgi:hypothetical protein
MQKAYALGRGDLGTTLTVCLGKYVRKVFNDTGHVLDKNMVLV